MSVGHPGPLDNSRGPLLPQGLSSWDDLPPPLFQFSLKAVFPLPPLPSVSLGVTPSALLSPVPLAAPQAQDSCILSVSLGLLSSRKSWVLAVWAPAAHISAPSVQECSDPAFYPSQKNSRVARTRVCWGTWFHSRRVSCVTWLIPPPPPDPSRGGLVEGGSEPPLLCAGLYAVSTCPSFPGLSGTWVLGAELPPCLTWRDSDRQWTPGPLSRDCRCSGWAGQEDVGMLCSGARWSQKDDSHQ